MSLHEARILFTQVVQDSFPADTTLFWYSLYEFEKSESNEQWKQLLHNTICAKYLSVATPSTETDKKHTQPPVA